VNRIFEVTDMLLTPEEVFELETAAKPLMNWLAETCHPHVAAIVDNERAEFMEGLTVVMKNKPSGL
jgi:hypothetical protein